MQSYTPKLIGEKYFCFQAEVGLYKVANIYNGKELYSIGKIIPVDEWCRHGHDVIEVIGGVEYVQDTGRLIWRIECANEKLCYIETCEVETGTDVQSVSIPKKYFTSFALLKVSGEWFIICESEKLEDNTILLSPYRLKDLKKTKNRITIPWLKSYYRIYKNEKLYLIKKNSVNILDLSEVLIFK